jgi:hypothetical protein
MILVLFVLSSALSMDGRHKAKSGKNSKSADKSVADLSVIVPKEFNRKQRKHIKLMHKKVAEVESRFGILLKFVDKNGLDSKENKSKFQKLIISENKKAKFSFTANGLRGVDIRMFPFTNTIELLQDFVKRLNRSIKEKSLRKVNLLDDERILKDKKEIENILDSLAKIEDFIDSNDKYETESQMLSIISSVRR